MAVYRVNVHIKQGDRDQIARILKNARKSSRMWRRVTMLCWLDQGQTVAQVSANIGADVRTVQDVARSYEENGLERALYLNRPSNRQKLLDASQLQLIKDMVCGPPPEGKPCWSIRLIAQEVVSRHVAQRVGRETIRKILKKSRES